MSGTGLGQPTGTYSFNPSLGSAVNVAFARCGLRRTQLTQEHYDDARAAANLILSDWQNEEPNLWLVQQNSLQCIEGQGTYSLPPTTMLILDAWLRIQYGNAEPFDYYMFPISRSEWAAFPDKFTPGRPTVYWFDRLIEPTVTIWQPPSDASWVFYYYSVQQFQDVALTNGATLPIPYYFFKAYVDRLSAELAIMYAPDRAQALLAVAQASWLKAANRNAEMVPLYVVPGLSGYYRGNN